AATHGDLHLGREGGCVLSLLCDDGGAVAPVLRQPRPRGWGLLGLQARLEVVGGPSRAAWPLGRARPGCGRGSGAGLLDLRRRALMLIRTLLADDHVIARQGLRLLWDQAGMVGMGEAADGPAALRLAHTHAPEVALLDIAMPHLNGLETARRLREAVPQ